MIKALSPHPIPFAKVKTLKYLSIILETDGNFQNSMINLEKVQSSGYRSLLVIKIKRAERLRKLDLLSKSDPYVEVVFNNDQTQRTTTIDDNQDPIWDEKLHFTLTS